MLLDALLSFGCFNGGVTSKFKLPFFEAIFCVFLFLVFFVESELFYNRLSPKFYAASLCTLFLAAFWIYEQGKGVRIKSKLVSYLVLTVAVSFFVSILNHESGELWVGIFRMLNWVALCYFLLVRALSVGVEKFIKNFTSCFFPISIFLVFSLVYFLFTGQKAEKAFMGNPSIISEILMISAIQALLFWGDIKNKALKIFTALIFFAHIALILDFKARAPLLGCLLALMVFSYKKYLIDFKMSAPVKKILGAAFVVGAMFFIFGLKNSDSIRNRWGHWVNTLYLIKDKPLGVGPGAYEYVFEQYNGKFFPSTEVSELVRVANPHNMFLEFFAELGIIGALAFVVLLLVLFKDILLKETKLGQVKMWIVCHLAGILPLALFIYPQDNPFPYVFLAFFLAVLFAYHSAFVLEEKSILRVPLLTVAVLSIVHASLILTSDYLLNQVNPDDAEVFPRAAYSLNKENQVASAVYIFALLNNSKFEEAKIVLDDFEKRFPKYSKVELLWGEYFERTGNMSVACTHYRNFDQTFMGKTSISEKLARLCP